MRISDWISDFGSSDLFRTGVDRMKTKTILVVGLAVLIGIGAGFGFSRWLAPVAPTQSDGGERKPLYYRNQMKPDVTSKVPANDKISMDYVDRKTVVEGKGEEVRVDLEGRRSHK